MDANGEARWLTRKLLRRVPQGTAGRWAALVSVWAHLLLLVGLAFTRWRPPPPPPEPPAPLELVLLERAPPGTADPLELLEPVGQPRSGGSSGRRVARPVVERTGDLGEGSGEVQVLAEAPPRHAVAPPSQDDPVEELRQALGFGPVDRSRLPRDRTAQAAMFGEPGLGSTTAVGDEPDVAFLEADALRGSRLGAYVDRVEALVNARWRASDLQVHSRAIGLQGDVTVRYTIARDGTVSNVRISRASGLPEIDGLAVRAIPLRLPRLPDDLGLQQLNHEITFRYHNPP